MPANENSGATVAPESPPRGFAADLRDAVTPRAVLLVLGVLLLQLGFIASYIGAFHNPTPHRIPLAVAGPAPVVDSAVGVLNSLPGDPLDARAVPDPAAAGRQVLDRRVAAAVVLQPQAAADQLLVASAAGSTLSQAVTEIVGTVESAQQRQIAVTDLRPLAAGDARGLTAFYLVVGWVVGGYLVAAILAISLGSRPSSGRRAVIRLGAQLLYAAVSGLIGAVIAGPGLHALPEATAQLWGIGTFVVFAAAAATTALQAVGGIVGLGAAILLFVILGNPSSGGAFPTELLPPFWAAIGQAIPTGAGTTAVRGVAYFDGEGISLALVVLGAYVLAGVVIAVAASAWAARRRRQARLAAVGG